MPQAKAQSRMRRAPSAFIMRCPVLAQHQAREKSQIPASWLLCAEWSVTWAARPGSELNQGEPPEPRLMRHSRIGLLSALGNRC